MIDPPQVRPEEPTAVTPHGGIRGGESQQWLSYPTKPHVRICAGMGNGAVHHTPTAPVLDSPPGRRVERVRFVCGMIADHAYFLVAI